MSSGQVNNAKSCECDISDATALRAADGDKREWQSYVGINRTMMTIC